MLLSLLCAIAFAKQDVPKGITYKKAPDAVNAIALKKLQDFYSGDPATVDFAPLASDVVICMPGMWSALKNIAPKELVDGPKTTSMVPTPEGLKQYEGRLLKTKDSQEYLWTALLAAAHGQNPTIRKANPDELRYYWAIISWDIEEPLYIADFGKHKILFNFDGNQKDPRIFVVEIVGSMSK